MNLDELRSLYDFTGRTVLITGGAGVLGAGIAHGLLGCHANVVILNRDQEKALQEASRLGAYAPEAVEQLRHSSRPPAIGIRRSPSTRRCVRREDRRLHRRWWSRVAARNRGTRSAVHEIGDPRATRIPARIVRTWRRRASWC